MDEQKSNYLILAQKQVFSDQLEDDLECMDFAEVMDKLSVTILDLIKKNNLTFPW